jgi:hypothetical protein
MKFYRTQMDYSLFIKLKSDIKNTVDSTPVIRNLRKVQKVFSKRT